MANKKIFVQIASYRDPQLIPTLDDLFENAKYPDNLVVCIAHQHAEEDEWDTLDKYKDDKRVKIIDINYKESRGACWARWKIQQEYNKEQYTLQLDSHHRFVPNWDEICIDMYEGLREQGYKKPLLTSYIPSFDPEKDPQARVQSPWGMSFDRFTPEGVVFFLPYYIEDNPLHPVPARFYSAHFAFTTGKFCKEVPHDPNLYFHGEEISIGVRAYTHGYDLFHPNKIIAWHEYTRKGRTKHWDDNSNWGDVNTASHRRMRQLLGVDGEICSSCNKKSFKGYDLGTKRTLAEYEEYAGIRFKDRAIKQSTIDNKLPGRNLGEEFNPKFKHALDLYAPDFKLDDYDFAAVIFEDKDGNELYRKDEQNFQRHLGQNKEWFTIWREANIQKPHKWIVWSYSKSKGWDVRKEMII